MSAQVFVEICCHLDLVCSSRFVVGTDCCYAQACFVDDEYKNNRLDDIAIKESPAVLDKYNKVKSALTDAVNIFTHKLKVPGKKS